MTVFGRSLWKIIIFKAILLIILANFLLPDFLNNNFETDEQRADYVSSSILEAKK